MRLNALIYFFKGSYEMAKLLVEDYKADVNLANKKQTTPLHLSVEGNLPNLEASRKAINQH